MGVAEISLGILQGLSEFEWVVNGLDLVLGVFTGLYCVGGGCSSPCCGLRLVIPINPRNVPSGTGVDAFHYMRHPPAGRLCHEPTAKNNDKKKNKKQEAS